MVNIPTQELLQIESETTPQSLIPTNTRAFQILQAAALASKQSRQQSILQIQTICISCVTKMERMISPKVTKRI